MLIFLTIVFIVIYTINLIKGGYMRSVLITLGEAEIKRQQENRSNMEFSDDVIKALLMIFFVGLPMLLLQIIYLIIAINVDPYLYPTIALMVYTVMVIATSFVSKKRNLDLSNDEAIQKHRTKIYKGRTLRSTFVTFVYLSYYIYILYALVIL